MMDRIGARARPVALALLLTACAPSRPLSDAQVQGLAVGELFVAREHARQLVVWSDARERGPTFETIDAADARADLRALGAAVTVPVRPVDAAALGRLFQAHPDGWAAFYAAYPGAPGLIELARPAWRGDSLATVVVGRACGEHCFNAWRVTLRVVMRGTAPTADVVATTPLRLPKS